MVATPRQVYPDSRNFTRVGARRFEVLNGLGERELPDSVITERQRRSLKRLVGMIGQRCSSDELMYLACAFEAAAHRKRADEEGLAQ